MKSQGQPGSQLQFLTPSPSSSQSIILSPRLVHCHRFHIVRAAADRSNARQPQRLYQSDDSRAASPTVTAVLARRAQPAGASFSTAIATETTTIDATFITP